MGSKMCGKKGRSGGRDGARALVILLLYIIRRYLKFRAIPTYYIF